jgi:hypothetical protein
MKKLLFSLSFLVLVTGLMAQTTYTWIGADGQGGNGDWTVTTNWSPNGLPHSAAPATDPKITVIINTSPTLSPTIRMTSNTATIHKMKVAGGGVVNISSDVATFNYRVLVRDSLTFEDGTKINLTGNVGAADGLNGAGIRIMLGDGTKFKFKGHNATSCFTSSDGHGHLSCGIQDTIGVNQVLQELYLDPTAKFNAVQMHKGAVLLKTNTTAKSVVFANTQGGYPGVLKLDNNVQLTITNEVASNVRLTYSGGGGAAVASVNASAPGSKVIIKAGNAAGYTGAQNIISGTQTLFFPDGKNLGATTIPYPGGIDALELDMGPLTFVPNENNPVKNLILKSGTLNNYTADKILEIDEDAGVLTIDAGATYDVSGIETHILYSTALNASGASLPATIKGGTTVSLYTQPISLTYSPVSFSGDLTRPALTISQGALSLVNNTISVNNASGTALGEGIYRLIAVAGGTINGSPKAAVTVTGSGIVANTTATIAVSGGNVNLIVNLSTDIDNSQRENVSVFVNSVRQLVINAPEKSNYAVFNAVGQQLAAGVTTSISQITNLRLFKGVYLVKVNNISKKVVVE